MTKKDCDWNPECGCGETCAFDLDEQPQVSPGLLRLLGVIAVFTFILVALSVFAGAALAHTAHPVNSGALGWKYPYECCHDNDCAMIPASAVTETPNGYHVVLAKGQHPMLKDKGFDQVIPYDSKRVKDSPDGEYHICLSGYLNSSGEHHLYCFFAGVRGF